MQAPRGEQIEHRDNQYHVNPRHHFPPERHQLFQVQAVGFLYAFVVGFQGVVVVGTEVDAEVGRLLPRQVERHGGRGLVRFQVAAVFILRCGLKDGAREGIVSNHHRGEELVFVANPAHFGALFLRVVFGFGEGLHAAVGEHVLQLRVAFLELTSALLLGYQLLPVHLQRVDILRQDTLHVVGNNLKTNHIIICGHGINKVDIRLGVIGMQTHGERAIVQPIRLKKEVGGLENTVVGGDERVG